MKKLFVMKKRSAVVLTLALTLVLSSLSLAKVYGAKAIELDAKASITVGLAESNTYEELKANDIKVTFYQVATVNESGEYEGKVDTFDAGIISDQTTASEWSTMATEIAEDSKLSECYRVEATIQDGTDTTASLETGKLGMYLMVVDPVETDEYTYEFSPALIAVPGNNYYSYDANGNAVVADEANDAWQYDVSAVLKPEYKDLYGNLVINKTVDTFNTSLNGTSFVYKVTAYKDYSAVDATLNGGNADGKLVYSNVVTIDFSEAGTQQAVIEHIPAGAKVTVEEVYTGATYKATSSTTATTQIVKDGNNDGVASVAFTNTYDDTLTGNGTAVVNRFTYTPNDDEMTGSWTWSSSAEIPVTEEVVEQ